MSDFSRPHPKSRQISGVLSASGSTEIHLNVCCPESKKIAFYIIHSYKPPVSILFHTKVLGSDECRGKTYCSEALEQHTDERDVECTNIRVFHIHAIQERKPHPNRRQHISRQNVFYCGRPTLLISRKHLLHYWQQIIFYSQLLTKLKFLFLPLSWRWQNRKSLFFHAVILPWHSFSIKSYLAISWKSQFVSVTFYSFKCRIIRLKKSS